MRTGVLLHPLSETKTPHQRDGGRRKREIFEGMAIDEKVRQESIQASKSIQNIRMS